MEIVETKHGEVVVVAPNESVSAAEDCSKLEQYLSRLVGKGEHRIVVDFDRVHRISARTLRTVLLAKQLLTPVSGALVLCNLCEKVQDTFAIGGFDRDFTIVDTLEEGVDRAGASGRAAADSALDPGLAALLPRLAAALGLGDAPETAADSTIPAETLKALISRTLGALERS